MQHAAQAGVDFRNRRVCNEIVADPARLNVFDQVAALSL
jgi:hypothetical protein